MCECKEVDDWSSYKDNYMWNPSICDCECNKVFKIDECLDIKSCSCKILLISKIISSRM